jgi:signal transduction histidine kinase
MAVSDNLVRTAAEERSGDAVLAREERIEALERELRERGERIDELESALKARDDFLSVAAHEMSNPMHALSMQLALITRMMKTRADRPLVDTELADRLQLVHNTLRRYVVRTTLLLDVSRTVAGMRRLERVPVDLHEVVGEAIALYRAKAIHHRVDLQLECKGSLIGRWDRVAIEQVVENLLSNAIKFGAGAPVIVRAALIDPDRVCLSVSDSGVGICAADQQRIFEKFEKAVASSYTHGGFGVGLWLVRNLVEAHGGSIEVESTPGKGSVFTVVLKLDEPAPYMADADRSGAAR